MQESPYLDDNGFLLEKLQRLPFLGALGGKYIKNLLRLSKIRKFDSGEVITKENTYDMWVYLLFSGAVRVMKNGKEISRLGEVGSTFGEVAVLDGKVRSASVEAIVPTVCLAIDASFLTEQSGEPLEQAVFISMLYKIFAEVLAGRLRKKDEDLDKLRSEVDGLRRDREGLRKTDEELVRVRAELDTLKKEVAKRWMIRK